MIVGWNDSTASVQSVSDSLGNTYTAVGTVLRGTSLSQAIYYAKNINGGSGNTVTVTFNQAAVKPDLRILEYSGVDPSNPLDVTTGASGNSYIADSGYIATRAANELIVGADMVSGNTTIMGGAPLNIRVITTTDSDLAADYQVNVPGQLSHVGASERFRTMVDASRHLPVGHRKRCSIRDECNPEQRRSRRRDRR